MKKFSERMPNECGNTKLFRIRVSNCRSNEFRFLHKCFTNTGKGNDREESAGWSFKDVRANDACGRLDNRIRSVFHRFGFSQE
jgi:hypothetical protein